MVPTAYSALIAVAVMLIVAGIFVFMSRNNSKLFAPVAQPQSPDLQEKEPQEVPPFCAHCGHLLENEGGFCPYCGVKRS